MSYENSAGLGVHNHYGARSSGRTTGVKKTEGSSYELAFNVTGEDVSAGGPLITDFTLPAGAVIEDVVVQVKEAFVLTGTNPTIEIGTATSEATNGFTITEAQAEAAGTYNLFTALSGTWDVPLAAAAEIGYAQAGTSPTVTDAGSMDVLIRYSVA